MQIYKTTIFSEGLLTKYIEFFWHSYSIYMKGVNQTTAGSKNKPFLAVSSTSFDGLAW